MPEHPLFVYGTLMEGAVQSRVLGRVCAHRAAHLKNYRVHYGAWPYALESEGDTATGIILMGLTDADFIKLDAYEREPTPDHPDGEIYIRRPVPVMDGDGAAIEVWAYFPLLHKWRPEWLEQKH